MYHLQNAIKTTKRRNSLLKNVAYEILTPPNLQKEQNTFYKGKHIFKMPNSLGALHHSILVLIFTLVINW